MSTVKERRLKKEKMDIENDRYEIEKWDLEELIILVSPTIKLRVVLGYNYPFTCPEIWVNDKPYKETLSLSPDQYKNFSKIRQKRECCLMCTSLACKHNWKIWHDIKMIIQDVERHLEWKRQVVAFQLWEKAKEKFCLDTCLSMFLYSDST